MTDETDGRIAALEVMLFAAIRCLRKTDFVAEFETEKERALTCLLNNPAIPDEMHDVIEKQLLLYERHLLGDRQAT